MCWSCCCCCVWCWLTLLCLVSVRWICSCSHIMASLADDMPASVVQGCCTAPENTTAARGARYPGVTGQQAGHHGSCCCSGAALVLTGRDPEAMARCANLHSEIACCWPAWQLQRNLPLALLYDGCNTPELLLCGLHCAHRSHSSLPCRQQQRQQQLGDWSALIRR